MRTGKPTRAFLARLSSLGVVTLAALTGSALMLGWPTPVETASASSAPPLTYVAIGASDAVGVGVGHPSTQGWVPQFAQSLGPNTSLVNLGVSGSTLAQALQEQLPPALDANPDVVTVWLAVNDLNARVPLDQYSADMDTLLSSLQPTGAQVLVGNVPDLASVAAYQGIDPATLEATIQMWNAAIADSAARNGAHVVDLYSNWQELSQHPEYISSDGFHPSAEGYTRIAQLFTQAYEQGS